MLYGRGTEQDRIRRMLVRAGAGDGDGAGGASGALVIHGEAGMGKTALLEYARGLAGPGRVLRTVGIESEMELAFGGLHQLLWPVASLLERLPRPQAAALSAAFGVSGEAVRDRFALGTAVLAILSQAAGGGPLLCVVDDSQWLDRASLDALVFAARRLHREGVVMLFAVRDGVPGGISAACRSFCCGGSIPRPSTPFSPTGWSPCRRMRGSRSSSRRRATRWPCWSCRRRSRPSSAAGS